ncbi:hypothetical protein ANCCAN_26931 [Ancylostoma caninum]|uniref:Conserved oligomeric Golgi complex subunit 8 n=1 Tax=Ancylostoma caninum TaxID=29170 RepID=A0A368F5C1_ANCCA|nr:hypothetical protein ANCCAN_26931 [Ancylostoma caninum]
MKEKLRAVSGQIPELAAELRSFHTRTKDLSNEVETVRSACQKDGPVWELLSLPSRMDVCIRAGYYEAAYSLTNYGMMLQQHSIIKNPLVKFTEMKEKLRAVSGQIPELAAELRSFHTRTKDLSNEVEIVRSACQKDGPVWELLSLPSRMDVCIRAGYYEAAYSLTNYGMMLQQHSIIKNPLVKSIADKLVEARSFLLEELFNKFSGPLDLASSIQNHPEFAIRAIEIYRDCMYDTLVLYLAVFPENETARKDVS